MNKSVEVVVTDIGDVVLSPNTKLFYHEVIGRHFRRYKGRHTKRSLAMIESEIVKYATKVLKKHPNKKMI